MWGFRALGFRVWFKALHPLQNPEGPSSRYLDTWVLGSSYYGRGFGQVYDYEVLGPSERSTLWKVDIYEGTLWLNRRGWKQISLLLLGVRFSVGPVVLCKMLCSEAKLM